MTQVSSGTNNRRPRVLMTLADVAWPVDAGKRLRAESMVRAVGRTCSLTVVVLFADADPQVNPLPPDVAGSWLVVPPCPRRPSRAGAAALRGRVPWQTAVQDWTGARAAVGDSAGYDLVWFGALDHFISLRKFVEAKRMIVDCDDVETDKLHQLLDLASSGELPLLERLQRRLELPLWSRIQRLTVQEADAVLVCSQLDKNRLIAQSGRPFADASKTVVTIANTYPEPNNVQPRHPQGTDSFVIVANYGTDQNRDAATFAARQILPALRAILPSARVRLVGRRIDRIAHLEGIDGLDVVGPVDSVAEELSRAHAVLIPIRFGGGTRLKALEAFAYGVPVVSTAAGVEGLDVEDARDVLVGETPVQLAACLYRIITEEGLAERLSANGRALYEREYRPQAASARVDALLTRLLPGFDLTAAGHG